MSAIVNSKPETKRLAAILAKQTPLIHNYMHVVLKRYLLRLLAFSIVSVNKPVSLQVFDNFKSNTLKTPLVNTTLR